MKKKISDKKINQIIEYLKDILIKNGNWVKDHSIYLDKDILEQILFITIASTERLIRPNITNLILRKLDLHEINWQNVVVECQDLSGTNVILDPQTVCSKSLYGGNYSFVDFTGKSFDDVDVRKAIFTGAIGLKINPQTIYDKSLFGGTFPKEAFETDSFEGVVRTRTVIISLPKQDNKSHNKDDISQIINLDIDNYIKNKTRKKIFK